MDDFTLKKKKFPMTFFYFFLKTFIVGKHREKKMLKAISKYINKRCFLLSKKLNSFGKIF
jgi:hypothetical protein